MIRKSSFWSCFNNRILMLIKILIDFNSLSLVSYFCLAGKQEASDRVLKLIRISTHIGILKQLQKLFKPDKPNYNQQKITACIKGEEH